jgi:hypothetical protein
LALKINPSKLENYPIFFKKRRRKTEVLIVESIAKIRRLHHVEKLGFKTITKALNLSKNTVKKIIRNDVSNLKYSRKSNCHRILEPYKEVLKTFLLEDEKASKKYRRTAKKLFLELQQQGYNESYNVVHHSLLS